MKDREPAEIHKYLVTKRILTNHPAQTAPRYSCQTSPYHWGQSKMAPKFMYGMHRQSLALQYKETAGKFRGGMGR
jgi:hypothetical protein